MALGSSVDSRGALMIDPKTGDPQAVSGWTVDVTKPQEVTVRGNYEKGFRVYVGDLVQTRAFPDPALAYMRADQLAGALERAN